MSDQPTGAGEPGATDPGSAAPDNGIPASPAARRRGDGPGGSLGVGRPYDHGPAESGGSAEPRDQAADLAGWSSVTTEGSDLRAAGSGAGWSAGTSGSGSAVPQHDTGWSVWDSVEPADSPPAPPSAPAPQPTDPLRAPSSTSATGRAPQPRGERPIPNRSPRGPRPEATGATASWSPDGPAPGQRAAGPAGPVPSASGPGTTGAPGAAGGAGDPAGRSREQGRPGAPIPTGAPPAGDGDDALFENLETRKPIPRRGIQGLIYRAIRVNLGLSKRDREELEVRQRLNRQLRRTRGFCGYVGIASEKGGVGKTTVAALLAAELAEGRRESVGVADLNPDLGTLPDRFGLRPQYSIRDLLAHVDEIPWRYHVHDFMEKVPEMNVRILAASTDRKIRHQLSKSDVELLAELFAPFFSFAILDNGTHITHEAMLGTLKLAHALVLVTDNTRDGANLARKTLQFLTDNGFPEIRRRAVLAVVAKETASPIKPRAIERAFRDYVRELVVVPYDPALDGGGPIPFHDPNAMNKLLRSQTRAAVRRLAAVVMDDLVS